MFFFVFFLFFEAYCEFCLRTPCDASPFFLIVNIFAKDFISPGIASQMNKPKQRESSIYF